jgi:hypothetical protein
MFGLEAIGVNSITDLAVLLGIIAVFVYYLGKLASSSNYSALDRGDVYINGFLYVWLVALFLGVVFLVFSLTPLNASLGHATAHYHWGYFIVFALWLVAFSFFRYMRRCKYEGVVPNISAGILHLSVVSMSVILTLCVIVFIESSISIYQKLLMLFFALPLYFVFATIYGFASWRVTPVLVHLPKGVIQGQLVRSDEKEIVILKNGKIQHIKTSHISRIEFI